MKDRTRTDMNTMRELKLPAPIFIGRWTPRILFSLKERPHRHGELRRYLGSVSQRMLTRTLRNLESTGLINRRVTRTKTVAVEYSLTKVGKTIIAPLRGMCRWAKRYGKLVSADVHLPGKTSEAS
jgi:DNA-binding HxlR family transcriptional regulator